MPQKSKSQYKHVQVALTEKSNRTRDKKTIVCHCWSGVYEAAIKLRDKLQHSCDSTHVSMSLLINCIISLIYEYNFGNEKQKGEN